MWSIKNGTNIFYILTHVIQDQIKHLHVQKTLQQIYNLSIDSDSCIKTTTLKPGPCEVRNVLSGPFNALTVVGIGRYKLFYAYVHMHNR